MEVRVNRNPRGYAITTGRVYPVLARTRGAEGDEERIYIVNNHGVVSRYSPAIFEVVGQEDIAWEAPSTVRMVRERHESGGRAPAISEEVVPTEAPEEPQAIPAPLTIQEIADMITISNEESEDPDEYYRYYCIKVGTTEFGSVSVARSFASCGILEVDGLDGLESIINSLISSFDTISTDLAESIMEVILQKIVETATAAEGAFILFSTNEDGHNPIYNSVFSALGAITGSGHNENSGNFIYWWMIPLN